MLFLDAWEKSYTTVDEKRELYLRLGRQIREWMESGEVKCKPLKTLHAQYYHPDSSRDDKLGICLHLALRTVAEQSTCEAKQAPHDSDTLTLLLHIKCENVKRCYNIAARLNRYPIRIPAGLENEQRTFKTKKHPEAKITGRAGDTIWNAGNIRRFRENDPWKNVDSSSTLS